MNYLSDISFETPSSEQLLSLAPVAALVVIPSSIYLLRCVSLSFDKWYLYRSTQLQSRTRYHLRPFQRGLLRLVGCSRYIAPAGGDDSIELAWIRHVIRQERNNPNSTWTDLPDPDTIQSVEIVKGPRGGFTGAMFKIAIRTTNSTSTSTSTTDSTSTSTQSSPDLTLVVKTVEPNRLFSTALLGSAREALFYRQLAPTSPFNEMALTPRVLYSDASLAAGNFVVVMEDLSPHAVSCCPLLGNQCWGAPPALPSGALLPAPEPLDLLERTFVQFAKVHARFWRDFSLLKMPWLKHVNWLQGRDRARWELSIDSTRAKWQSILKRTADSTIVWPNELLAVMRSALDNTSWAEFRKRFDPNNPGTPFTLSHGDFHAANFLWNHSTGALTTVDWSEVGVFCPFTDIAQYLVSNTTIEFRRKHEQQLFRLYYDQLIASGVDQARFTDDQCFERYKSGGIERWLTMVVILGALHSANPAHFPAFALQWFIDQTQAFIIDHANTCSKPIVFMTAYCLANW